MRRATFTAIIFSGCALAATAIAAQSNTSVADASISTSAMIEAAPDGGNGIGTQAMHDATAAAVVGALKTQFNEREVELKLDTIDSARVSRRDIGVDGTAQIRIEGSRVWLPIRFHALYDTATLTAISPVITLAGNDDGTTPAADVPIAGLDRAVAAKLGAEFAAQQVDFDLAELQVSGGDARYAVVDGKGMATFAGEGDAAVRVQAVYDRAVHEWVRVDYSLGEDSDAAATAVALR